MLLRDMESTPRLFLLEYAISISVFCACGGTIIIKLMDYYGFSLAVSNFLLALPSAFLPLQLVGGYFYERSNHKHRFLLRVGCMWRVLQSLVFLTVLLPFSMGAASMLAAYFALVACHQFVNAAQTAWLVNSSEGHISSNFYSLRELFVVIFYVVLSMSFGGLIDFANDQLGKAFMAIGVIVALAMVWDAFYFFRLPPPQESPGRAVRLRDYLEPFRQPAFLQVLSFHGVWHISNMFIGNFAGVYQIQVLGLDTVYLITWSIIANLVKIAGIPIFAKIADRIGWKALTLGTVLGFAITGVMWMFVTPQNSSWYYPILVIVGILPGCGHGVGFFKFLISNCSTEKRNTYFGVNAAVAGLCATAGATICSLLAEFLQKSSATPSYWVIFFIGIMGMLLAAWLVARTPYQEK